MYSSPRSGRTRLVSIGAVVLVLAVIGAGCGIGRRTTASPPASVDGKGTVHVPTGSSSQNITVDGLSRVFRVYRPASLPAAPVPMVVMMHGGYGDAGQAETQYGWDAKADAGHFVVVYPQGENRAWNAGGGCCGQPAKQGIDDVAFVTKVVSTIEHELRIDPARVDATGISNGGLMAYRLACDTDVFAAIGPDSATLMGACDHPRPISVLAIHGTADDRIPYDGGKGSGFASVVDGPSVPSINAKWRAVDQCRDPITTTSGPVSRSTATCPDDRAVGLITIVGAGHQWPGGKPLTLTAKALGLDEPSKALDATDTLWTFFAAHPKP